MHLFISYRDTYELTSLDRYLAANSTAQKYNFTWAGQVRFVNSNQSEDTSDKVFIDIRRVLRIRRSANRTGKHPNRPM
jgi:hypothetical protein